MSSRVSMLYELRVVWAAGMNQSDVCVLFGWLVGWLFVVRPATRSRLDDKTRAMLCWKRINVRQWGVRFSLADFVF